MELPTAKSIAGLEHLVYVSEPWIEDRFPDLDREDVVDRLVKRVTDTHREIWDEAHAPKRGAFITNMERYVAHERLVRDSLDGLLEEPFVLLDPTNAGDRRKGVEPHSPRNDLRSGLESSGVSGRVFSIGPLLVPFDLERGRISLPLEDRMIALGFARDELPWRGYVRFNPSLFDGRNAPFERDSHESARAQIARSMLALRVRAIESRLRARGPSDERRVFGFSSGPLWRAITDSPLAFPEYKQVGGRLSSGRRADQQGIMSDPGIAKLQGLFAEEPAKPSERTRTVSYTTNEKYPWLLEPGPHRLDLLVDRLADRFGEDVLARFGEYARDRGIGVTHALPRLSDLHATRVTLADGSSLALDDLVSDVRPAVRSDSLDTRAPIIRASDASVHPYGCPLAHHIAGLDRESRSDLLRAHLDRGTDDRTRAKLLEHRNPETLESDMLRFGSFVHALYAHPWVEFESDYAPYGPLARIAEVAVSATLETKAGPIGIRARADIALEGTGEDGIVPLFIDRKLSRATERMQHAHRRQLALMFAAYRSHIEARGERMPYAIGVIDASAPYSPHPRSYRPQRFVARRFTNEEIDDALETAAGLAYRRDAIRSDVDLRDVRRESERYRIGPKGGRASPLCATCGTLKRVGDTIEYRGSLATRMVCDELNAS